MGAEDDVEPGVPGFARVRGGDGGFADAAVDRFPCAADTTFPAGGGEIGAGEDHLAGLEGAFDDEEFAAVCDPGLMPDFS